MKAVGKTTLEVLIFGVTSVAVGFTANAVRPRDSIDPWKNYFPPPLPPVSEEPAQPYPVVTFEEVSAIFNNPNTAMGVNLFVDARDDASYEEGHIPGAIQADHYRLDEYIDDLLAYVEAAEKVIVYCNGGDCEDSMFLCTDLLEFEVCFGKIHVYPGGWEEWKAHNMPIAKGREQEEQSEPRPSGSGLEQE